MCSQLRGKAGGLPACVVCGKKFPLYELFVAAPGLRWCAECVTDEQREQVRAYTEALDAAKKEARRMSRMMHQRRRRALERNAAEKARWEAEAKAAKEREIELVKAEKERQRAEAKALREAERAKTEAEGRERKRAEYQRMVAKMREVYEDPKEWQGAEFLACTPESYPINARHAQMCPVL